MKKLFVIPAIVLALLVSGCGARGGGWIDSITGEGKATFGFAIKCTQIDAHNIVLSGQVQYNDTPAGVKFHGEIVQPYTVSSAEVSCDDPFVVGNPTFIGTYRMEPSGETGGFTLTTSDYGEPGPGTGDYVTIRIYEGPAYSSLLIYAHGGVIQGGNIQFEEQARSE